MGWSSAAYLPTLDATTAAWLRVAYAVLLFSTLVWALPNWRRFFLAERWGGYAQSSRATDLLHNPYIASLLFATWIAAAVLLILGRFIVVAALVNLLLCRHYFVAMRWKGVLRGMGAPGFMTYWLACVVFLIECAQHHAPDVLKLVVLVFQIDFAFIMLSAGIYKATAGYIHNDGMELGLANPEWGYWYKQYRKIRTDHILLKILNQLAWLTEVVAGVLMLVPRTRFLGALLIMGSFVFIAANIRLGFLCEMVIVCGLLFVHPGSVLAQGMTRMAPVSATLDVQPIPLLNVVIRATLLVYLMVLPLAHAGLFYNFYGKRPLPRPIQVALEWYTNFFGIIIWRVFSVDVTNFYIDLYVERRGGGARQKVSNYGIANGMRFAHVGESITVTSLFTTLKYYPSNNSLFVERLMRYAKTLGCPSDAVLVFEYVALGKSAGRFVAQSVAEFVVDVDAGTVVERALASASRLRAAHANSPVHEGIAPGSYVPIRGRVE